MSKKVNLGIIVIIIALVGGVVSFKKTVKNITLIGTIQPSQKMSSILSICDSRTLLEAQQACAESGDNVSNEVNQLCHIRLSSDTETFNNKCLRFYRFVKRAENSQKNVSEFLKTGEYEHLILENEDTIPGVQLDSKKTAYLFKSNALASYSQKHPNYAEEIGICKDYQIENACETMKTFFDLYSNTVMSYLNQTHAKNIIVVIEQDHMKHFSCKNFNQRKFNCNEVVF